MQKNPYLSKLGQQFLFTSNKLAGENEIIVDRQNRHKALRAGEGKEILTKSISVTEGMKSDVFP